MKLLPLDSGEVIELAAGWLAQKENYQWLDFGNGQQIIKPPVLKIMAQRDTHLLRVYTPDDDDTPIGIVALENVNRKFHTATLWGAAGDKSFRSRGYAAKASDLLLDYAFNELGLHVVNTWVVDGNPSQRIVEKLGFRYCGRQRQCHYIDDQAHDRLMFDILAAEHAEGRERRRTARPRRERRQRSQASRRLASG